MQPTDGMAGRQLLRSFLKRGKRDIGPATSALSVQAGRRGLVLISPPVKSLLIRKALTLVIFKMRPSVLEDDVRPAPAAARQCSAPQRAHRRRNAPHYIGRVWDG